MDKFQSLFGPTAAVVASLALMAACGGGSDSVNISTSTTTTTTTVGDTTTSSIMTFASARLSNFGRGFCVKEDDTGHVVAASTCFANVPGDNWRVNDTGTGRQVFINLQSNKCLTVDALTANPLGGNAVTVACDGSPRVLFSVPKSTAVVGGFQLKNQESTQCLEISAANNTAGGQVTQWECTPNQDSQTWTLTRTN